MGYKIRKGGVATASTQHTLSPRDFRRLNISEARGRNGSGGNREEDMVVYNLYADLVEEYLLSPPMRGTKDRKIMNQEKIDRVNWNRTCSKRYTIQTSGPS